MMPYVRQTGLSLVELMVGLVIGLITILIIGQSMAVFEGDKRTTTGGADAQTNGYAALMAMERDIRAAGSGLVGADARLVCEGATYRRYDGALETTETPPNGFLPPIRIEAGGSGDGGDAIVLVRPDMNYGAPVPSVLATGWVPGGTNCVSQGGVQEATTKGDLFLVAPAQHKGKAVDLAGLPAPEHECIIVQASVPPPAPSASTVCNMPAPNDVYSLELTTAVGSAQPYNQTVYFPPSLGAGDLVIALGAKPYVRYGVDGNKLVFAEQMEYVARGRSYVDDERRVDDIVYIAAQYGIDTECAAITMPGDCADAAGAAGQSVDRYVAPAGSYSHTTLTPASFTRIKSIRIAVVARSPQYNKDLVSPASITLWQKINGADDSAPVYDVPDRHYRYRVFETVAPLRNMIWGQL